jgi:hypothetical protein
VDGEGDDDPPVGQTPTPAVRKFIEPVSAAGLVVPALVRACKPLLLQILLLILDSYYHFSSCLSATTAASTGLMTTRTAAITLTTTSTAPPPQKSGSDPLSAALGGHVATPPSVAALRLRMLREWRRQSTVRRLFLVQQ